MSCFQPGQEATAAVTWRQWDPALTSRIWTKGFMELFWWWWGIKLIPLQRILNRALYTRYMCVLPIARLYTTYIYLPPLVRTRNIQHTLHRNGFFPSSVAASVCSIPPLFKMRNRLVFIYKDISHTIHVWYIYLHLADFEGKCR